jgi:hypothetical protein
VAAATYIYRTRGWSAPGLDGIAAVFNNSDPASSIGDVIEVRRVYVRNGGKGYNAIGVGIVGGGKLAVTRITAAAGGRLLTAAQHRTADAALPSQIKVRANPDTCALSAGGDMRLLIDLNESGFWVGQNYFPVVMPNEGSGALRTGAVLRHEDTTATVDSLTLAEGEGVAVTQRLFGTPMVRFAQVTITDDTTGATHTFQADVASGFGQDDALISVMNETGSGTTINVRSIALVPFNNGGIGVNATFADVTRRLVKLEGFVGGFSESPVVFRTARPIAPGIQCVRGPFLTRAPGATEGVTYDWNTTQAASQMTLLAQSTAGRMRRLRFVQGFSGDGTQNPQPPMYAAGWDRMWDTESGRSGIFLAPGEGLAVASLDDDCNVTLSWDVFDVEFVFTAERPNNMGAGIARPTLT